MIDGMLLSAAGVFILVPGFVSDIVGLVLLLPPTRALVRRRMLRSAPRSAPRRFTPGTVIDGEVVDESPPPPPGPELR